MTSEPDIKSTRKSKSTALAKLSSLPVGEPVVQSGSNLKNTLIILGVVMILAGYGYAGFIFYKRLCKIEDDIKVTLKQIESEKKRKDNVDSSFEFIEKDSTKDTELEFEQYPELEPEPEPQPEPEPEPECEPEPEPAPKRRGGRRSTKKLVFDVDSNQTVTFDDKETLVPSDDL